MPQLQPQASRSFVPSRLSGATIPTSISILLSVAVVRTRNMDGGASAGAITSDDVRCLIVEIQARLESVASNAEAAMRGLEDMRETARSGTADGVSSDAVDDALRAIDARCAELRGQIGLAQAAKVAALEAELVEADFALEHLHDSLEGGDCRSTLLAMFGAPPLVPAELDSLFLVPGTTGDANIAYLCAPRGIGPSDIELESIPTKVLIRKGVPDTLCINVVVRSCSDKVATPEGSSCVSESLVSRLRVTATLSCAPAADVRSDPTVPAPLTLAVSTVVNPRGDGALVTVDLPHPLPSEHLERGCAVCVDSFALGGVSLIAAGSPLTEPLPVVPGRPRPGLVIPAGALFDACQRCNAVDVRRILAGPPEAWSTEETHAVRRQARGWEVFFLLNLLYLPHRAPEKRVSS